MSEYFKKDDIVNLLYKHGFLKTKELEYIQTVKPVKSFLYACQACGFLYDNCICQHNKIVKTLKEKLLKEVKDE